MACSLFEAVEGPVPGTYDVSFNNMKQSWLLALISVGFKSKLGDGNCIVQASRRRLVQWARARVKQVYFGKI